MFQFLAITKAGCRRLFPRHLLHRITTLTFFIAAIVIPQVIYTKQVSAKSSERPNIVLIMSDDMGYSDIECYGGEIKTPNLNRLADNGVRFTQFYNTARCCPTRASLLTGLYPHQTGIGHMTSDRGFDGYRGDLNRKCMTIAEVLRHSGYSTYMSGKWHVTKHLAHDGPKHNWPLQRGFDKFYGTILGAGSFYDPTTLTRQNTQITPVNDKEYQPKGQYYYTDAISDNAVRYIQQHKTGRVESAEDDSPFFMYVAYTAAHWPMHALEKDVAKYKGRYDGGYDAIRRARYERMQKIGLINSDCKYSNTVGDWEQVKNRDWEIRCMEVYAAMVDNMDQGIGRIVGALESTEQLDNTLILFLQDNGGCAESLGRSSRGKWTEPTKEPVLPPLKVNELQPAMIPASTRSGFPTIQGPGAMPGPDGTYIAYGRAWANASNTPFREYKHWVHEGGISTPLIAHWPLGIKRRGDLEHQPGHLIDVMATCVDISGAQYPTTFQDEKIKPLEGHSLRPAFKGEKIQREAIYWEHEGNRAVRVGDWKLVAKGANGAWELYNIAKDRSELRELSAEHPDKAKQLTDMWLAYAERANVLPLNARAVKRNQSKKKVFKLKTGADLLQDKSPNVRQRAFTLKATLKADKPNGVIVAQGGTAHGYALYVQEGQLRFATRIGGKLSVVSAKTPSLSEQSELQVKLSKNGKVRLLHNDKLIAEGTTGLLVDMPVDGLQVGKDLNGAVGQYEVPFAFEGAIEGVEVNLE
jgi:arylsulfatase